MHKIYTRFIPKFIPALFENFTHFKAVLLKIQTYKKECFNPFLNTIKNSPPCWVNCFLARRKGFEPPTFWFVAKYENAENR